MPVARTIRSDSGTIVRVIAALAAAVALATASLLAAGAARAGTTHTVVITDYAFSPPTLTIQVGDTVTWTNLDPVPHSATSTEGAFDSGLRYQDQSFSYTFTEPGTYPYLCTPHPYMNGQIVVQAAAAAPGAGAGGGAIPDVAMPAPETIDPTLPIGVAIVALAAVPAAILLRHRHPD